MFFCRHHLLRAPAQRQFTGLITTRSAPHLPASSHAYLRLNHARAAHSPPPASHTTLSADTHGADTAPTSSTLNLTDCTTDSPALVPEPSNVILEWQDGEEAPSSEEAAESKKQIRKERFATYLAARRQGDDVVMQLTSETFTDAILHCVNANKSEHLPSIIEDATNLLERRANKVRGRIVMEVLLGTLNTRRVLTKEQILAILQCMERHEQLRYIRTSIRTVVARALMAYPPNDEMDRKLLDLVLPLLLDKLPSISDPTRPNGDRARNAALERTQSGAAVPRVLWPLYRITFRLAQLGERSKASDLIASLVEHRLIDARAIESTDLSSTDFDYVVLSVLLRSCLEYGWFSRATTLLQTVLPSKEEISPPFAKLVEHWLLRALSQPREVDVEQTASVIITLLQRSQEYVLPAKLLQRFYDAAFLCNMPELAETVYSRSRGIKHYSVPPPRSLSLLRLMEFLSEKSRNVHLARTLANQVVDENIPLSQTTRAPFIYHVALLGFATQARVLWERYSARPDGRYVTGNGTTMLRMVSLFVHVADQTKAAAERKRPDASAAHRENLVDDAPEDQGEADQTTPPRTLSIEQDLPASDAPRSHSTPPPHEPSVEEPPSASGSARTEDGTQDLKGFAGLSYSELVEREADLRRFADRVFNAYQEAKEPLERAAHYDLTTLARGASILQRDSLSLSVFTIMKQRGMKMDMHDVNLALGVAAKVDPTAGAEHLQRLIASGVQPDAVAFGTVIHRAAQHGDVALVDSLVRQAREVGLEELSFKAMASLLHAAVAGKMSQEMSASAQLEYANKTVDSMLRLGSRPTPNVARDCITAALRAGEPAKAFEFWRLFVKGKTQWDDPVQRRVRSQIAKQVREHLKQGWVEFERGAVMLYELGYSDDMFALARYRASPRVAAQASSEEAGGKAKGTEGG